MASLRKDNRKAEQRASTGTSDVDDYTAGIDLLNACRRFYVTRLRLAETARTRLSRDCGHGDGSDSGRSTMDRASWHRKDGSLGPGIAFAVRLLKNEIVRILFINVPAVA